MSLLETGLFGHELVMGSLTPGWYLPDGCKYIKSNYALSQNNYICGEFSVVAVNKYFVETLSLIHI